MNGSSSGAFRGATLFVVLGLCCASCERIASPTPEEGAAASLVSSDLGDVVRDVPATRVALPPHARDFDTDDAALGRAIEGAGGLAFVGFKSAASPRLSATQGHRAAVPQAATRAALDVLRHEGVEILEVYGASAMAYVRVPAGSAGALRRNPAVDFVEPPSHRAGIDESALPVSPMRVPARAGGAAASQSVPWNITMVRAPQAWPYARGTQAKVMLLGTGLSAHVDLPTIPPGNCAGYFNACSSPLPDGQALLGIVAAIDNSYGIVGAAPGLQPQAIYIWRMVRDDYTPDWNLYLSGLNSATLAGIKTVLVEVIATEYWQAEATAIAAAWSAGTIVVAGVGSNGQRVTETYPASLPDVIGVSGVRDDSVFASAPVSGCTYGPGSNYGPMVDLAAPFWAVTTYLGGYYDTKWVAHWCVSKLAAAHVAGIVALLQDRFPADPPGDIWYRLRATASHPAFQDEHIGFGVPDAGAAVLASPPVPPVLVSVTMSGPSAVPAYTYCTWSAGAYGGEEPYTYQWTLDGWPAGDGTNILYITTGASPFVLAVSATDANGRSGASMLSVAVDGSVPSCNAQ